MFGFSRFGDDEEIEDGRTTWPPCGSAQLVIKEEKDMLFTSANWTIKAYVDGTVMWRSKTSDVTYGEAFLRQWARFVIRKFYKDLREAGVDAEEDYISFGGKADELE